MRLSEDAMSADAQGVVSLMLPFICLSSGFQRGLDIFDRTTYLAREPGSRLVSTCVILYRAMILVHVVSAVVMACSSAIVARAGWQFVSAQHYVHLLHAAASSIAYEEAVLTPSRRRSLSIVGIRRLFRTCARAPVLRYRRCVTSPRTYLRCL